MEILLIIAVAYFMGAVPFGVLFARLAGAADPRSYGSGNIGATNVARGGSKLAAVLTLGADAGKAAAAVLLAAFWVEGVVAGAAGADVAAGFVIAAPAVAGAAAVLGHVSSPFLKFRGGRGVACALAVYLCWQPFVGLGALLAWAAVFAVSRYSSLASLSAVILATVLTYFFTAMPFFLAALFINVLILLRHQDNLRRLFAGKEKGF